MRITSDIAQVCQSMYSTLCEQQREKEKERDRDRYRDRETETQRQTEEEEEEEKLFGVHITVHIL